MPVKADKKPDKKAARRRVPKRQVPEDRGESTSGMEPTVISVTSPVTPYWTKIPPKSAVTLRAHGKSGRLRIFRIFPIISVGSRTIPAARPLSRG
jgi:hypothetical protein